MRILVTSFPAYGHFHPLAPLALAAQAAGHEVRLATGPDFVAWVERCGLAAFPIGMAQEDAVHAAQHRYAEEHAAAHLFTSVWVPAALADLRLPARVWRPDLVLHEEEEYAGLVLAASLGVPSVTHSWPAPARPLPARRLAETLVAPVWNEALPGVAVRTTGDVYLDACPAPPANRGLVCGRSRASGPTDAV